jgi:hypothetical protein
MQTAKWLLCFLVMAVATVAGAHEGHEHAASGVKLTGEIVDITCFMDHSSKGDKHAACARKCIEHGLPVGLLVGSKLYAVILSTHESPNEKLAPFAGQLVTMTGTVVEKDGMRVIDMASVAPAAK